MSYEDKVIAPPTSESDPTLYSIELVDLIYRDSADMQYMTMQKNLKQSPSCLNIWDTEQYTCRLAVDINTVSIILEITFTLHTTSLSSTPLL